MIPRPKPERFRLRRTMMFMNAQKPGLIKDAYIYGVDSIMLDLEDAVAENQKDAARFSLYHALKTIDYGDTEVIVRINGLDTPHWQEDIRVCVAGGADGIRIAKCESAQDVKTVEEATLAARAAGVQCFDTVFTDLDDMDGFIAEVRQNKEMGFDGKSLINPKQITAVHQIFAPTQKEIAAAEKIVRAMRENADKGIGVFTVDGKMIDLAFLPGAERTIKLAKASGLYEGDL